MNLQDEISASKKGKTPTKKHHTYAWVWITCVFFVCLTLILLVIFGKNDLRNLIGMYGKKFTLILSGMGILPILKVVTDHINKLIRG